MSDKKDFLFEKFSIQEYLKKDSFSCVYLADHIYLEKKIILKTLDTESLPDDSILERFKREARILAGLDHPNIIKVLDFGMYQKYFYISFEYFESKNLRKVIKEHLLNADQKTSLIVQMLSGLKEAHSRHIIHRDIKPENILVNDNLELKIADFGLAMVSNELIVTNQYSIVGTPGYMSPEQVRGDKLTIKSDLFSAGIVAYELFTLINPFLGRDINETINKILESSETYLNEMPEMQPSVDKVIRRLLDKNITSRYDSADEALQDLGIAPAAAEPEIPETKKYLKFIIPAAAVILIFILFFFIRFTQPEDDLNAQRANTEEIKFAAPDTLNQTISIPETIQNENKKETTLEEQENKTTLLADKKNTVEAPLVVNGKGELFVECIPWAAIFIDSQKIDTTPLKRNIQLSAGEHVVVLIHPDFPPYSTRIRIEHEKVHQMKFRFDSVVGYLDCMIHPWGEIFINGESKGHTPLRKPIALVPGSYTLTVKNPNFTAYTEYVSIRKNDTLHLKVNLSDY